MVPLGNLLTDYKEYERAEEVYRAAIQLNDRNARHNLGIMFLEVGDRESAIYHLRFSAAMGDELSVRKLRELGER